LTKMNQPTLFDQPTGNDLKDTGIAVCISANSEDYERVMSFAKKWIIGKSQEFTSEDMKTAFLESNPPVKQQNVYGSVWNVLARQKAIIPVGASVATLPKAHGRLIRTWRVAA